MMEIDRTIPGADLISKGFHDLAHSHQSQESLLIHIAEPALRFTGLAFPKLPSLEKEAELILYVLLCKSHPGNPHSAYNTLIRRVSSFCKNYRFAQSSS